MDGDPPLKKFHLQVVFVGPCSEPAKSPSCPIPFTPINVLFSALYTKGHLLLVSANRKQLKSSIKHILPPKLFELKAFLKKC